MRASLNVRLSRLASDSNLSLEGMLEDLRTLAARNNFQIIAEHVDDGISGAVRDRPGFQAWLDDAREGRADVLLAWHVDRMTREGLQVAAMLLDVTEGKDRDGRAVHPPVRLMDTAGLDSARGESFRLEFVIKAEIARAERERMKARSKARMERLAAAGRYSGGKVPFGYRSVDAPDGKGKTLVAVPEEKAAILKAAEMILDGHGAGDVARWLTNSGIRPRHADRRATEKRSVYEGWSRSSVERILTSDTILGRIVSKGVVRRHEDGSPVVAWEPLIDLATHRALVAKLAPKKSAPHNPPTVPQGRGRLPSRLLVGVMRCESCGSKMYNSWPHKDKSFYRCGSQPQGRFCAAPAHVNAEAVEAFVIKEFLEVAVRLPMLERRVVVADDGELARVEDLHAATLSALGADATPELFARLQELGAQLAELRARPQETRIELVNTGRSMADEWARRDLLGQREMIQDAMTITCERQPGIKRGPGGQVRFDPSRVKLAWRVDAHEPADL